jgi:hypothetical protein
MNDREILTAKARHDATNAFKSNQFAEKFPSQCEHILRLITERLHLGLDKRDGTDPAIPETWKLNSNEIADLAEAMFHLNQVRLSLK